jgi:glycosyltransferase involved in cell wall biosynthesis
VKISVVVPTYKRPDMLERCLGALVTQDFARHQYEIIVADDGPDEAVLALVTRWATAARGAPDIRYVAVTDTQGPAGARNKGWRVAHGEVIAFTDDDTVPHPDWLSEGWRAMAQGVVAAAGQVIVPRPAGVPTDYERDIMRMEEAEFVTANCFVRRGALEAIGGFDERFTSAWREDSDLQFTLLKLHGRVARAHDAVVKHPVRPVPHWTYGLRQHRKIVFDALLYKKHPELYRERIRHGPPWRYYAIIAGFSTMVAGIAMRSPWLAVGGLLLWAVLTVAFVMQRLEGTSRSPEHVAEMVATSIAIPFVAVYWRLVGAWRYRVLFL